MTTRFILQFPTELGASFPIYGTNGAPLGMATPNPATAIPEMTLTREQFDELRDSVFKNQLSHNPTAIPQVLFIAEDRTEHLTAEACLAHEQKRGEIPIEERDPAAAHDLNLILGLVTNRARKRNELAEMTRLGRPRVDEVLNRFPDRFKIVNGRVKQAVLSA